MKQGYARRNRGSGRIDWTFMMKTFPLHRNHILRIRNRQEKLVDLWKRLVKKYGFSR